MKRSAIPETLEERKSRIFAERARRLSRNVPPGDDRRDRMEVVEFLLGAERYAVESGYVGEVFLPAGITPIPCTPPMVAGVVNLRGRIVSVIDLKILFGMPPPEEPAPQRVILLHSDAMEIGLLADGFPEITTVLPAGLHPPLPAQAGTRGPYILGIEGDDLAVLDGARILGDSSLVVNEEP